ncbi:hypothetical protein M9435_005553 [Picochlorum sp. BPE23]|nr:hypothetical protein M9435_005553 [Picochlorum sp. BPE23]
MDNASGNSTLCDPGADQWIEEYFQDCVYGKRDHVGFYLGLASILCWLVAQAPQLYYNYKRKSAEALSPYFLAEWLLGDTSNLLGALLKGDQPQTLVFTAEYFIIMDCIMMVQRHAARQHAGDGVSSSVASTRPLLTLGAMAGMSLMYSFSQNGRQQGRGLVLSNEHEEDALVALVGAGLAYLSCVLYLFSRSSQIYKNWKRKSAEGLSPHMFLFAVCANLFYGVSVILRSSTKEEFMSSLPWLIGSLGTVSLDFVILMQSLNSRGVKQDTQGDDEIHGGDDDLERPLVSNDGDDT